VLCSSDEEYAVLGPELYNKLEGKAIPVIAGNPPCMEELRNKGLKYFISIRSDLVETLSMFHRLTGLNK
jgi:methylmalonyl-CoA mutase